MIRMVSSCRGTGTFIHWPARSAGERCFCAPVREVVRAGQDETTIRIIRNIPRTLPLAFQPPKINVRIKAPLNTSTGTRKACLKPARNSLGKVPRHAVQHLPGGGLRPPLGEVPAGVSGILPEQVLN